MGDMWDDDDWLTPAILGAVFIFAGAGKWLVQGAAVVVGGAALLAGGAIVLPIVGAVHGLTALGNGYADHRFQKEHDRQVKERQAHRDAAEAEQAILRWQEIEARKRAADIKQFKDAFACNWHDAKLDLGKSIRSFTKTCLTSRSRRGACFSSRRFG
jgi:hypothetical protein